MILRLRRLTPGYFRLLQTQTTQRLAVVPLGQGNWVAMLLAMSGFCLSAFSTQKMTAARGGGWVIDARGTEAHGHRRS
ncbi:unnamed protein product [Lampetra fluviatilis]